MNLLTKTTPWVVASLLAAATAFGDDKCRPQKSFEQGRQLAQTQMMPGYDAPARVDVRGAWDFFASGSFIYWQLLQDDMQYAFVDNQSLAASTATPSLVQGNFTEMNFKYQPGFKVGLGMNFDQDSWDAYSEYTRLYAKDHASTEGVLVAGAQAPIFPVLGHPTLMNGNVFNSASAHWVCDFNFADIDLGRMYYVGTNLTFRPAFGARAAWIQQSIHANYVNNVFTTDGEGIADVYARTHSWALGPRAGIDTNWMVGQGIRFYGNASADILYTKYNVQYKTNFLAASSGLMDSFIAQDAVMALRTHMDLELGLGWGSYFDNNNWHIDLSASYGFQVFFNQNMFPRYANSSMPANLTANNGNLYAQGLTANVRLDF